jgi:hypothetical protein
LKPVVDGRSKKDREASAHQLETYDLGRAARHYCVPISKLSTFESLSVELVTL